jgi:RNA polymerase-binding transcription factor DksA
VFKKVKKKEQKPAVGRTSVKKDSPSKKKATAKASGKSGKKASLQKVKAAKAKERSNPVIVRRTWLSKTDLEHFRTLLIEKLNEITGDVRHIESGALKLSRLDASGDLSSMPIHMADIGSDNYEQEFALGLMDSERKIVLEILAALRRIQNGTYGMCEGTGNPIPRARLEGIPWTRFCVEYAEMLEKGSQNEEAASSEDASEKEESRDKYGEDEDKDQTDRDEDLDELDISDDGVVYDSDRKDEDEGEEKLQ